MAPLRKVGIPGGLNKVVWSKSCHGTYLKSIGQWGIGKRLWGAAERGLSRQRQGIVLKRSLRLGELVAIEGERGVIAPMDCESEDAPTEMVARGRDFSRSWGLLVRRRRRRRWRGR